MLDRPRIGTVNEHYPNLRSARITEEKRATPRHAQYAHLIGGTHPP